MRLYLNILLSTFFILSACSSKDNSIKEIVSEWAGRELTVDYDRFSIGGDPTVMNPAEYDYKIINYVDSSSCNRCRMKLDLWNLYMSRLDAADANVALFTIVKSKDVEDVMNIVKSTPYNYPIMLDSLGTFVNKNNPPDDIRFNTFLLDSDDKIVAIGNPALMPTVGDLFRNIILGDSICETQSPAIVVTPSRNLGITHPSEIVNTDFLISNKTGEALTLDTIITSCDCISASLRSNRIESQTIARLTATLTPDTIQGSFQRQIYIYFKEIETPSIVHLTGINKSTL